ncbi:hypothetical protein TNCT_99331 [Trichonephila clavata]|uniref:Uncharacterized protein n=1 Tax=Trichonephila clavata TaxID=2740835 RepID=A0A8X6J8H5_TRICU|nr:hypothetical protein TNCT_99331 [Trichonephila clavata]
MKKVRVCKIFMELLSYNSEGIPPCIVLMNNLQVSSEMLKTHRHGHQIYLSNFDILGTMSHLLRVPCKQSAVENANSTNMESTGKKDSSP